MTCGACASRIESELHATEGVSAAHVNFAANRASVTYDPDLLSERDLLNRIDGLGYRALPGELHLDGEEPRWTSGKALVITLALAAASMVISSIAALRFAGWEWLVLGLTMPVVLISGMVFHGPGWRAVRRGHATMDTLVSLGSLVAWGWSAVVTIGGLDGHIYFDTAAVIVAVVLLGRHLETRARRRAGDAIGALVGLGAGSVRLPDGSDIPPSQLAVGMTFLVRPGERIAADGVVTEGHSAVDTSIVTGEPVPAEVAPGDEVTGGTLNTYGSLVVEARRVGADGTLAQVVRLVSEALSRKAPIQRLADRISAVFVPAVVVVAVTTLVVWLVLESASAAISPAVAVLIVACPCALGLATPAAFMAGSGRGARMGVIIRGPDALEAARRVDVVALDKTGTVTEGHLEVVAVEVVDGTDADSLLASAAALEARSEHPVAAAIVRAARSGSVDGVDGAESASTNFPDGELAVADFRNLPGFGVEGRLVRAGAVAGSASGRPGSGTARTDEATIIVGRAELFERVPAALEDAAADHAAAGRTLVFVGGNESAWGFLALADRVKPSSAAAVADWKRAGIEVVILSGDNSAAAEQVGRQVEADRVFAGLTPAGKVTEIERLQAAGRRVAMVGDGVNDAPALAAAEVGVAIGTGADVAAEASDLTLVGDDLRLAVDALSLARRTLGTIRGNLFWAFVYNTAAIPLAAVGLLRPEIAAAAMGLSSLFVLGNSLRLNRFAPLRA
ncbi:MAG: metal-transporting ATPase [Acidimicrobiia bacterium]|nr:metal-transporting ATPase [Acidimicrobiia bacterium]MYC44867.1 metal-transporting ATPase [Acidimicrobiia bacterium]MYI18526.1 metal-transporting ATPase [Acidimicrobiia bacterium]